MTNETTRTNRDREGRYDHKDDALCTCGHRRGVHTMRGGDCIAADFDATIEVCSCEKFKKGR